MNLRARLQRLEARIPDPGCPGCRDRRGLIVLVEPRRMPDGTIMLETQRPTREGMLVEPGRPPPCSVCGKVPEQIIEIMEAGVARESPK